MQRLPWLVVADEQASAERRRLRTEQALVDLHRLADRIRPHGSHLVLEGAVDYAYDFDAYELPEGTVDARGHDALGVALADPGAVVVTAEGIMFPLFVAADVRWQLLATAGRTRARLGCSMLSGAYFGLRVDGPFAS